MDGPLVLVTGATGYIGLHLVQALLRNQYRVRGTVRSVANDEKMNPLKEVWNNNCQLPLDVVEADLLKDPGWTEAVSGCSYVLHVAGPFPNQQPKDEAEVVVPTVEGTRRVLQACAREVKNGGALLKRVVLTSSCGAVHGESIVEEGRVYNEQDWTDPDSPYTEPFHKSKTVAERLAWELVSSLPEDSKFELTVLNLGYTIGPVLSGTLRTSQELVSRLLDRRRLPLLPEIHIALCDVRDVVEAHLKCMTLPEVAGTRNICVNGSFWMKEIAKVIQEEFHSQGYKTATHYAPYAMLWVASMFDKSIELVMHRYYKTYTYDSTRMKTVLGISPIDPRKSIIDCAHSIIKYGIVKKTKHYVEPKYDFQN